jgi:hypothetical protein
MDNPKICNLRNCHISINQHIRHLMNASIHNLFMHQMHKQHPKPLLKSSAREVDGGSNIAEKNYAHNDVFFSQNDDFFRAKYFIIAYN